MDNLPYWIGGVAIPLLIAWIGVLCKHMINDHAIELDLRVKQAFLEGETRGLNERISRLEDLADFGGPRVRTATYFDEPRRDPA